LFLLLVQYTAADTHQVVEAVREATFANGLNGRSDAAQEAHAAAQAIRPAPGQGRLSSAHEAAFAKGVRNTDGVDDDEGDEGDGGRVPRPLPNLPDVDRTTWDEPQAAAPATTTSQPHATASRGLQRDLHDLQMVAKKLGDSKVDAELEQVQSDIADSVSAQMKPTVSFSTPGTGQNGRSSHWHKSWRVLPPVALAPSAPQVSPAPPQFPQTASLPEVSAPHAGPEGSQALANNAHQTGWDKLRNQFHRVPGHALPVTGDAEPPAVQVQPYGQADAIALCNQSCWSNKKASALCMDKRRYVIGERIVVCMQGLPGLQGDGAGIYLNGKLYTEKSTTVDANNHATGKAGSYSHADDLSFFDTLDKNVHHASTTSSANSDAVYWVNSDGSRGQGAFLSTKKGIRQAAALIRPVSLPVGVYSMRLFFGNDPHKPKAAFMFTVVDGAEVFRAPAGNITIMTMNMMVAAKGHVQQVAEAIFRSQAEIVGLQECDIASLTEIKEFLRAKDHAKYRNAEVVHYYLPHGLGTQYICMLSCHPILQHYTKSGLWAHGIKTRLADGTAIRVFNSHLEAFPYGPYMVRDGKTALEAHSATLRQTADVTHALSEIVESEANEPDLTSFFVGDFNCPSPLDWSQENVLQNGEVVPWGPSTAMLNHDFVDSFRLAHPDVLNERGFTWTPGLDGNPKKLPINEVHDRIDFTFHRAADDVDITVPQSYVSKDVTPWPSDHRSVVTSYLLLKQQA
jgi:exonuclease III